LHASIYIVSQIKRLFHEFTLILKSFTLFRYS